MILFQVFTEEEKEAAIASGSRTPKVPAICVTDESDDVVMIPSDVKSDGVNLTPKRGDCGNSGKTPITKKSLFTPKVNKPNKSPKPAGSGKKVDGSVTPKATSKKIPKSDKKVDGSTAKVTSNNTPKSSKKVDGSATPKGISNKTSKIAGSGKKVEGSATPKTKSSAKKPGSLINFFQKKNVNTPPKVESKIDTNTDDDCITLD